MHLLLYWNVSIAGIDAGWLGPAFITKPVNTFDFKFDDGVYLTFSKVLAHTMMPAFSGVTLDPFVIQHLSFAFGVCDFTILVFARVT